MKKAYSLLFTFYVLICYHPVTGQSVHPKKYSLLLGGDFYFGETYQEKEAVKGKKNILKEYGYDYSINKLVPLLKKADKIILNLETPVTDVVNSPFSAQQKYKIHKADIHKTPASLKKFNISGVSLANNHAMDYGEPGLKQTLKILHENSIECLGAGPDEKQAAQPLHIDFTFDKKLFPVVIAAGLDFSKKYDSAYHFYADKNIAGVNSWNNKEASKQIKRIRLADTTAFIIAYPHWFTNYKWKTNSEEELAHALIDAGADMVIGHGSHMFQEIELYKGKWIIYSLGNFIFNAPGRYHKKNIHPYSLAAMLEINEKQNTLAMGLKLYPILSDNHKTNYQPRPANNKEMDAVYELLRSHSINANEKKDYERGKDETGYFINLKFNR